MRLFATKQKENFVTIFFILIINGSMEGIIEANLATLLNLSTIVAQFLSTLNDGSKTKKKYFNSTVHISNCDRNMGSYDCIQFEKFGPESQCKWVEEKIMMWISLSIKANHTLSEIYKYEIGVCKSELL